MPHDPVRCAGGAFWTYRTGHCTTRMCTYTAGHTYAYREYNTCFVSGGDRRFQIVAAAASVQTRFPHVRKLITLRFPSKRTRPDLRLATRYPPVPKSIEGHTRSLTVQRKTGDYTRLGLCPVQQRCSRR